jgi:hypothetical protein
MIQSPQHDQEGRGSAGTCGHCFTMLGETKDRVIEMLALSMTHCRDAMERAHG